MQCKIVANLEEVPAADWNRLAGEDNPFVRHEFLIALERYRCVGQEAGWLPRHFLVYDADRLVGASPQYVKFNSYGEFVFDWSWADAYTRAGLSYYPKLVVGIPYTPVAGPRLLAEHGTSTERITELVINGCISYARETQVSSLHWLFTTASDTHQLERCGLLRRTGFQYHWSNPGYRDFDDFLDELTSKRRKQIKRERRTVLDAGVRVEVIPGQEITDHQWTTYYQFYRSLFDRKWGIPTLTLPFFQTVGRTMGDRVLLVLARHQGRYVGGALCFRGSDTLFGRHWGCSEFLRNLHFELCYYQTIEFCIRHGLHRLEAGAQGEHKISRGFLPVPTFSTHWIAHDDFRRAIGAFVGSEEKEVERFMQEAARHSPFRSTQHRSVRSFDLRA